MQVNYIPSLDGIRAVSITIVLLSHAGLGYIIPGGLGVTIFFFLSGFLITTLLNNEYDYSGRIHYTKFFIRRFLRLFPPLIITLIVVYSLSFIGIVDGEPSLSSFLSQMFYLANYHTIFHWSGGTPQGLGILWSLAVEEHFYLFFPILLYFLLHNIGKKNTSYFILTICLIVLAWRFYLIVFEFKPSIRTYYATDTRIDSILFGCLLSLTFNPSTPPLTHIKLQ